MSIPLNALIVMPRRPRGKGAALAERVVRTGAAVEQLPDGGDVARVASDEHGRPFLADQRHDRRVVAEVADGHLGLAEPHEPRVGFDLDEAGVERVVLAEVADVRGRQKSARTATTREPS
jgi:hypothetical protein